MGVGFLVAATFAAVVVEETSPLRLGITFGAGKSGFLESNAKNLSQLSSTNIKDQGLDTTRMELGGIRELSGDRKGSVFAAICLSITLSLCLGGVIVTSPTIPARKFVLPAPAPPLGDPPMPTTPPVGLIRLFHCCTLLTASSNFVVAPNPSAFDEAGFFVVAPAIHGCLRSLRAETRKRGSFWKH